MSLLELLPCHVTPGARALSYQRLELVPCHFTPEALADEFTSPCDVLLSPSRVTLGSIAQSCHSCSSRRRSYKSLRRIAFAQ